MYSSIVFSSAGQNAPLFTMPLNAGHQVDGGGAVTELVLPTSCQIPSSTAIGISPRSDRQVMPRFAPTQR